MPEQIHPHEVGNIEILALGDRKTLYFAFLIANPEPEPAIVRVLARDVCEPACIEQLCRTLGQDLPFGDTPLDWAEVALGDEHSDGPLTGPLDDAMAGGLGYEDEVLLPLAPGEVRQGILAVGRNPRSRPGEFHAVDVVQLTLDGRLQGGLTVVVQH
jgi:hypothetical protein